MPRRKRNHPDPAPAEILHLCAQIRRNWSETMHRVRAGYGQNFEAVAKRDNWSPPVIDTTEIEIPREMMF
jgi:hypothetical protein